MGDRHLKFHEIRDNLARAGRSCGDVALIADLTGGSSPSTGFVHGLLARCATVVRETVNAMKSLITLAHVVGFDETTLRAGPGRPAPAPTSSPPGHRAV